jgi:hypothetical protein
MVCGSVMGLQLTLSLRFVCVPVQVKFTGKGAMEI